MECCCWCFFFPSPLEACVFYLSNPTDLDAYHVTGFIEGRDIDFPVCPQSDPTKFVIGDTETLNKLHFPFEKMGLIQDFHRF